ncbi:hypothetical protein ACFPRL_32530 [Pseudoclavibacter helvolus]
MPEDVDSWSSVSRFLVSSIHGSRNPGVCEPWPGQVTTIMNSIMTAPEPSAL